VGPAHRQHTSINVDMASLCVSGGVVVKGMRGSLAGNSTPRQRVSRSSVTARSRTVQVSAIVTLPHSPAEDFSRAGDEDYSDPRVRRSARIRIDEQWCVPNTRPDLTLSVLRCVRWSGEHA